MKRGNRRGQEKNNRNTAQDTLKNHSAECGSTQPLYPCALLAQPCPEGKNNRQKPDKRSHQPMTVFEEDTANPLRVWKRKHVPAVGCRPVGHTQTRLCA